MWAKKNNRKAATRFRIRSNFYRFLSWNPFGKMCSWKTDSVNLKKDKGSLGVSSLDKIHMFSQKGFKALHSWALKRWKIEERMNFFSIRSPKWSSQNILSGVKTNPTLQLSPPLLLKIDKLRNASHLPGGAPSITLTLEREFVLNIPNF